MTDSTSFDSIGLSGKLDVVIKLGPGLPDELSHPDEARAQTLGVRFDGGSVPFEAPEDLEEPIPVQVNATALSRIGAFRGANVKVSGSAEHLKFIAFHNACIDAAELSLTTAEVDLETFSKVSIAATERVSGGVAYGAHLVLLTEPEHTKIATGNAGQISPP